MESHITYPIIRSLSDGYWKTSLGKSRHISPWYTLYGVFSCPMAYVSVTMTLRTSLEEQ